MKYNIKFKGINLINLLVFCGFFLITFFGNSQSQQLIYPPEDLLWNADSLGNQRAVIRVNENLEDVTVEIEWRNRNVTPQQMVYVVDSTRNKIIPNVEEILMSPEKGIIKFPTSNKTGIYYIYYLPYTLEGSRSYPTAVYKKQEKMASLFKNNKDKEITDEVQVLRLESVNSFNSNEPMEIIATKMEIEDFKHKYDNKDYIVFPEKRIFPIKMRDYLPQKWIERDLTNTFTDKAKRGENFTFQLGIWAISNDLKDVSVNFTNLTDEKGNILSKDRFTCFNTAGIDYTGKPFTKTVNVERGTVQALWCGIQIPKGIPAGIYSGTATITTENGKPTPITLEIAISNELASKGGINEPWKQTRLEWLNSTLAQKNTVIAPYIPLKVNENTISLLGRKVILASNGLPKQIQSFFTEEMTEISTKSKNILSAPFKFEFINQKGEEIMMTNSSKLTFIEKEPGTVKWQASKTSPQLTMEVKGSLEFDGYANFEVMVIANQDISLQDISMHIPVREEAAQYMLGLGFKGGHRHENVNWKWDVTHKNQDGFWLGAVNAGLQLTLKDQHYERPLNTNFYLQKPLLLPTSWGNENKGGITIHQEDKTVHVNNYSGKRNMQKGDTLFYNFTLLITPFHTLQTDKHWKNRYYHAYNPIDSVIASGANIINIHHGNELNPYINYPFIATKKLKSYIDSAHNAGLKVKIYNTIREVSNHMYELYPIVSLDHEIFPPGPGEGYSWLQEHLHDNYMDAWFVPRFKDAAIINSGMNRWHNYYVEGMNWLVNNVGIDGIYLDDVAFDRVTMKRIKRVLTQDAHPGLIDLHSANQYNERDGFNNSAHLYMEHFPYIDRLWFGEYFDYENGTPDFYLTEVSGIPFGLMGEMLQDGGNPWRGMLYGMTNRMPYQKKKPDNIWKIWDKFGMEGSEMIGYWVNDNPVKTNNEKVLATVYLKENKALVSIASWAPNDTHIKLDINWKKLGINPANTTITAPEIHNFQPAAVFNPNENIPIEKNKGRLLIIK